MSVLIDTPIWSLALRRSSDRFNPDQRRLLTEWRSLITTGQGFMIGPIRQEILSGIREQRVFQSLRNRLQFFDCINIVIDDYDQAAVYFNVLRSNGLIVSPIDALICAVANRCAVSIFTIATSSSMQITCLFRCIGSNQSAGQKINFD